MDASQCICMEKLYQHHGKRGGMLIGPKALKRLNSIERIQPRMMAATFNGNPRATISSCYSPTNVSEETEKLPSTMSYPIYYVAFRNTTC